MFGVIVFFLSTFWLSIGFILGLLFFARQRLSRLHRAVEAEPGTHIQKSRVLAWVSREATIFGKSEDSL